MIDRFHQTFATVARLGSYTKAAQELYLTQPAVTQHVKALEEHYGASLFERVGRSPRLTAAGLILLRHLEQAAIIERALDIELRNASTAVQTYRVGATLTIGEYVLPALLGEYARRFAQHEITLEVENTSAITRRVLNEQLDLGFVEGAFDRRLFETQLYRRDELILVAAADSELGQRKRLGIEELDELRLILREPGSGTRQSFDEALLASGRSALKPSMSIGSLTSIKRMVLAGLGATVISRLAVADELAAGVMTEVEIEGLRIEREFNFIYRKNGPRAFILNFIDFCQEELNKSEGGA